MDDVHNLNFVVLRNLERAGPAVFFSSKDGFIDLKLLCAVKKRRNYEHRRYQVHGANGVAPNLHEIRRTVRLAQQRGYVLTAMTTGFRPTQPQRRNFLVVATFALLHASHGVRSILAGDNDTDTQSSVLRALANNASDNVDHGTRSTTVQEPPRTTKGVQEVVAGEEVGLGLGIGAGSVCSNEDTLALQQTPHELSSKCGGANIRTEGDESVTTGSCRPADTRGFTSVHKEDYGSSDTFGETHSDRTRHGLLGAVERSVTLGKGRGLGADWKARQQTGDLTHSGDRRDSGILDGENKLSSSGRNATSQLEGADKGDKEILDPWKAYDVLADADPVTSWETLRQV